ncbi:hypothetical protein HK103_000711 [Boothiomyces macroporosus]|uniref:mannan endo-1,4-beta-mannosidase n=1 Tax=Boothiomyces macroporosus TaxID=261099 RepID=A0AAD5UC75_9FUNG|nr:hypothetical protein HK103_000711 [Boothiomyces macroporosus]
MKFVRALACGKLYDQCGGAQFSGSTCCVEGTKCVYQNQWYSQCQSVPSTTCGNLWDKCGGIGFNGPACCVAGAQCVYQDQYYSQCKPSSNTVAPVPPTATIPPVTTTPPQPSPTSVPQVTTMSPTATLLSNDQMNGFVKTNGASLSLLGKPFYFGATNFYKLFYSYESDLPYIFSDAVAIKSSVVRTWCFCDGVNCDSTSYTNFSFHFTDYDSVNKRLTFNDDVNSGIGRLDRVLQYAKQYGNWGDFGGVDYYVEKFSTNQQKTHSDFYTNAAVIAQFKSYISHILNRVNTLTGIAYKDDPTIMAWELGNELRCVGSGQFPRDSNCNAATITKWVDDISTFIKTIDTNHLVAIGDEGFFQYNNFNPNANGYAGSPYSNLWNGDNDFVGNARLKNIDILTFHTYFNQWNTKGDPAFIQNTLQWIKDHAAVAQSVGKPIYVGEYGIDVADQRRTDFPILQKQIEDSNISGSLMWLLLSHNGTLPCREIPDENGLNFGLCVSDPDTANILVPHGTRMFNKGAMDTNANFVTRNGMQLMYNGKPFYFGGTNVYNLFISSNSDIDTIFANLAALDARVVRTWLFADGKNNGAYFNGQQVWFLDFDSQGNIYFNDDTNTGLGRLDYAIQSAQKHGIKLIFTLANNWNAFGGIDVYINALPNASSRLHSMFFTNPQIKAQFKQYISHVLNRVNTLTNIAYKNDPTIMAFELLNEARCTGGNENTNPTDPNCGKNAVITKWVDEMSTYIKTVDGNHLIAAGDEGFFNSYSKYSQTYPLAYSNIYDGSAGGDFEATARLENVDILGLHSYFNQWMDSSHFNQDVYLHYTQSWIADHQAVAKAVNKPIYLGEYGIGNTAIRLNTYPIIQNSLDSLNYAGSATWNMNAGNCQPQNENDDSYCYNADGIQTFMKNYDTKMKNKQ